MKDFYINPPFGLLDKILKRIHKEERLLVLRRVIIFSIILLASAVGFFPAFNMLAADLNQSGFLRFLSLTFSDFPIVTTYWQSFVMILLESLPALSLALFLAILLAFLQSIKSLTRDVKIILKTAN
jgi:hypothetical protein